MNRDAYIVKIRDITQIQKLSEISAKNEMLTLCTSSVSHEMITPLKCINLITEKLISEIKDPN